MDDERTPLLRRLDSLEERIGNHHAQFCALTGVVPSNLPKNGPSYKASKTSLYERARVRRASQNRTYLFTAALTNTLLLSQIVIGAALTALGASESSHILVAIFGALNTVIAGLVTYLKSRGQPGRARMFRDDLDRVVDEIENSEVMWLGISRQMHGYDDEDMDEVSVRSEVARLTRLYDKAVRNNTLNNPDMYMQESASGQDLSTRLRARSTPQATPSASAPAVPSVTDQTPAIAAAPPASDPDESPATAKPKPSTQKPSPTDNESGQTGGRTQSVDASSQDTSASAAQQDDAVNGRPLATNADESPVTSNSKNRY